MNNILLSSVGRRSRMMSNFRATLNNRGLVVATDFWSVAPALFFADKYYVVPPIIDESYIDKVLEICKIDDIKAITTFIDPEIGILARNRDLFIANGILPLCPSETSASLCLDKYSMFQFLSEKGINTVLTFDSLKSFVEAYDANRIAFPVFVKPRSGSGSVGACKIENMDELKSVLSEQKYDYIIQEYMPYGDCDADVYVDCISREVVSVFSKRKIETRIGGASKTISFKDPLLFDFIKKIVAEFEFYGPLDMDFFMKDGEYYLSEINPRFGGAYLHAYGAGVDFVENIITNMNGLPNKVTIGDYEEGVLMLMYDDVVIVKESDLAEDYRK